MEDTQKQQPKQNYDWLKQYQFQKGQSGNPGGRPKGKSLKTFAREMLEGMNDEEKAEFLKWLDPKMVWEMAEGKAKQDTDITSGGDKIQFQVINYGENNNDTPQLHTEEVSTGVPESTTEVQN